MARHHTLPARPGRSAAETLACRAVILCAAMMLALLAGPSGAAAEGRRPFVAYLTSWTEVKTDDPAKTRLARLPGYITHVMVGIARPDLTYAGNLDISGTGWRFPFSGQVLKGAIDELRRRHPHMRIMLAVGGWNQFNWDNRNFGALARLVKDLGADGVDLDYETPGSGCARGPDGRVSCTDDARFIAVFEDLRRTFPRPYEVSVAGWSVGAYGEGAFAASEPRYGPYVGMMLALLRSPAAAGIDLISIMSYDTIPRYRPEEAFRAYRALWSGPLAMGFQVLPPQNGTRRPGLDRVLQLLAGVREDPLGGAMIYALGLKPPGPPGPDNPDDIMLTQAICLGLSLKDCAQPVP